MEVTDLWPFVTQRIGPSLLRRDMDYQKQLRLEGRSSAGLLGQLSPTLVMVLGSRSLQSHQPTLTRLVGMEPEEAAAFPR